MVRQTTLLKLKEMERILIKGLELKSATSNWPHLHQVELSNVVFPGKS